MIIEYPAIKYRHELKHKIHAGEAIVLSSRLKTFMRLDPNANEKGNYFIHSLYFDTPDDKALKEKLNGNLQREKFRIRYYNDNLEFIRLEKKIKHNGLCAKRSTRLTKEETQAIIDGKIDFLLTSKDPLKIEFYSKLKGELLRPSVIVSYERKAFIYDVSNVRVTIDQNLYTYKNTKEFLKLSHQRIKVDQQWVLEVKYNEFLPDIVKKTLQGIARQTGTYSKFAKSRLMDW